MRQKPGFTLIEVLLVMVIIAILVSILVPRWSSSRERAFQAAMKSDLRNLATAEESYYFENAAYTTALSALNGFRPSQGVSITVNQASMGGWSATATHRSAAKQCYLFVGSASPVGVANSEGQIACQ